MQAASATLASSELRVQQHFDRSASLYVDHGLEVYQTSVAQRLDMILAHSHFEVTDELSLLDVGCGGGAFLDLFLERFRSARATGIDISAGMLAGNRSNERKTLLQGDALALPLGLGRYDVIAVDTVMHHLIDRSSYTKTQHRIKSFLTSLQSHLTPGGIVLIREIYHEFLGVESFGSRAIFKLTTLPVPPLLERVFRAAGLQTANVGVCFQTRSQWQELFKRSGYKVVATEDRVWPGQPYRRFGFSQSGDLHFVISRQRRRATDR